MKAKIDYAFLGFLGVLMAISIAGMLTYNFVLNLNNLFGFIGWSVALIIRIVKPRLGRYFVAWLIALGTLNLVSFSIIKSSAVVGYGDFSTPGVDPILLLVLIAYYFINRKSINGKIVRTFRGSPEEQEMKHQKMVDFYLTRFQDLSIDEFETIFKNINSYPDEAQVALKQIHSQKQL